MPTSELSNALNPYIIQDRPGQSVAGYPVPLQQVASTPHQYVPHRSELELAISEPHPPPQPAPPSRPTLKPRGLLPQECVLSLQELVRTAVMTKEAQEIECKRRLAWEQEQEARFAQRQAETEQTILELRQEIQALRTLLHRQAMVPGSLQQQQSPQISQLASTQAALLQPVTSTGGLFTPHYGMSPAVQKQPAPQQPSTPITPTLISQPRTLPQHTFAQAAYPQPPCGQPPTRLATHQNLTYPAQTAARPQLRQPQPQHVYQNNPHPQDRSRVPIRPERYPIAQSVTPSPSPQLSVSQPPTDSSLSGMKRKTSEVSSDGKSDTETDDSDAAPAPRMRRINHHDKRCLTIQHAMRLHFIRCMKLETDKELPDTHEGSATLDESQPVRFVWDKTTKQSLHNARMKTRILTDLKAKRSLYKHVPDKDFSKKVLDAAFEQCFVTFRQKFKAQRDAAAATTMRRREDQKARRARHLSRRKLKLSNRAEARQKLSVFEHVTFDGAFQLECMSSEESDEDEPGPSSTTRLGGVLCTRGYEWRSARLIRFYCILDDEERSDKSTKPKRGVGKRGRRVGPPKEGFHLPPKGVATWMISRKWLNGAQRGQPDLSEVLSKLMVNPPEFDWGRFDVLGVESDIEGDSHSEHGMHQHEACNLHVQQLNAMPMGQSQYPSTLSLNYTLV